MRSAKQPDLPKASRQIPQKLPETMPGDDSVCHENFYPNDDDVPAVTGLLRVVAVEHDVGNPANSNDGDDGPPPLEDFNDDLDHWWAKEEGPSEGDDSDEDDEDVFGNLNKRPKCDPLFPESELDIQMDKALSDEWQALFHRVQTVVRPAPLQPWERGFAEQVLHPRHPTSFIAPKLPTVSMPFDLARDHKPSLSEQKVLSTKISSIPGAWQAVSTRLKNLKSHQSEDQRRHVALAKWQAILEMASSHCSLGRKLLSDMLSFKSDNFLEQVVRDAFAKKSTSTLTKRANHLMAFVDYCRKRCWEPFPFSESLFYKFLLDSAAGQTATRPASLKESVSFTIGTLGIDGAKEVVSSERILGHVHNAQLTKRPTKQAKLLKCRQIVALERTLRDEEAWMPDRAKAGHDLYCTFSRLRWKDSQYVTNPEIDTRDDGSGYLETKALLTKTSTTAQKKTTFLPIVTPLDGIELQAWPKLWLEVREKAGLKPLGSRDDKGNVIPAMPTILNYGIFTNEPLSSTAAGRWLRELVSKGPHATADDPTGTTSHALKSTTLSWCSRHGSMTPYERKILGYHADSAEGSMHTYSRDVVAEPIRKYELMIADVASGRFHPDSTRSGYHKGFNPRASRKPDSLHSSNIVGNGDKLLSSASGSKDVPFTQPLRLQAASDDESKSSSSSSSSDSSVSSDQDFLLKHLRPVTASSMSRSCAKALGDRRFVHSRLKTLHAGHVQEPGKLACGRNLHEGFREVSEKEDETPFHACATCFGKS